MSENNFIFGIYNEDEMLTLLRMADTDPLLAGFVYPDDKSKMRLPIFENSQLVGFATPRLLKTKIFLIKKLAFAAFESI